MAGTAHYGELLDRMIAAIADQHRTLFQRPGESSGASSASSSVSPSPPQQQRRQRRQRNKLESPALNLSVALNTSFDGSAMRSSSTSSMYYYQEQPDDDDNDDRNDDGGDDGDDDDVDVDVDGAIESAAEVDHAPPATERLYPQLEQQLDAVERDAAAAAAVSCVDAAAVPTTPNANATPTTTTTTTSITTTRTTTPPLEIDVVVSGGGFRGYYCCGALSLLRRHPERFNIRRISGASAGAWCGVMYFCDIDVVTWANTYHTTRHYTQHEGVSIIDAFRRFACEILPLDAHLRCNGRLYVSITKVGARGFENMMVSHFESRDDLIEACLASANIPFFSASNLGSLFRGQRVLDGGVTNNVPIFTDGLRPQLVFRLSSVAYPFSLSLAVSDPCIEALIVRGAMEMSHFLHVHHDLLHPTEPYCVNTDLETFFATYRIQTHQQSMPRSSHPQDHHQHHHLQAPVEQEYEDLLTAATTLPSSSLHADQHQDYDDVSLEFPPIQLLPPFRLHPDQWLRMRKADEKKKRWSSLRSIAAMVALVSLAFVRIVRLDFFILYRRFRWIRFLATASLLTRVLSGFIQVRRVFLLF